jgi:hypothetical protein
MIAYTPVDIDVTIPNDIDYSEYVKTHHMTNLTQTYGYTSMLCPLISRNPVVDWKDATEVFADHTGNTLYYAPGVKENFPELIDLIHRLPYKEIFGAVLNLHLNELPPHQDELTNIDIVGPDRYNVLLTQHYNQESFFICKEPNSEKIYPKIIKEYPVYAFNNNRIYHGADKVLNDRVILICGGILDHDQHFELINRSLNKFKDYVIQF